MRLTLSGNRFASALAVGALVLAGAVASVVAPALTAPAAAADLRNFEPGFIISDAIFYDSGTMTAAGIATFLEARAPGCVAGSDGTPCLKNFRQDTTTRPADARCQGQYTGATNESAAQIIAKVGLACGINPRVILVMLQKEQGLLTASKSSLYPSRYRSAMGYGCPDTAACDAKYYGFFNQVYSAASQLKNYALNPTRYGHVAGRANNVRFHPNAACGTSSVYIQNQATASLYNYTPYQPNGPATAAGYGTGDGCSSYGNRNFWNYFNDWFGPTTDRAPAGSLDSVVPGANAVTATGWALDPDTRNPIGVHMYVDGASAAFTANGSRPDVGALYAKGDNHGFAATMATSPGSHSVCVYAINDAPTGNTQLGCRTVVVANRAPIGSIESATAGAGKVTVTGWALDPDSNASIAVTIRSGGSSSTTPATIARPDVGRVWGRGDAHGYSATITTPLGAHSVCIDAANATSGPGAQLGCRTVTVTVPDPAAPNRAPMGNLESVTVGSATISTTGWALDPDTTAPIPVHMYVDGASAASTAGDSRPDVGTVWGLGANHGFATSMAAKPGSHSVCLYAINATPGANTQVGCRTVVVAAVAANRAPIGNLETVTAGSGTITATGWALDPDTDASIAVHMYVDSASAAFAAAGPRTDVATVWGRGAAHGFATSMTATPGNHTVCLYAINATPGANSSLGCRTVTSK